MLMRVVKLIKGDLIYLQVMGKFKNWVSTKSSQTIAVARTKNCFMLRSKIWMLAIWKLVAAKIIIKNYL